MFHRVLHKGEQGQRRDRQPLDGAVDFLPQLDVHPVADLLDAQKLPHHGQLPFQWDQAQALRKQVAHIVGMLDAEFLDTLVLLFLGHSVDEGETVHKKVGFDLQLVILHLGLCQGQFFLVQVNAEFFDLAGKIVKSLHRVVELLDSSPFDRLPLGGVFPHVLDKMVQGDLNIAVIVLRV